MAEVKQMDGVALFDGLFKSASGYEERSLQVSVLRAEDMAIDLLKNSYSYYVIM